MSRNLSPEVRNQQVYYSHVATHYAQHYSRAVLDAMCGEGFFQQESCAIYGFDPMWKLRYRLAPRYFWGLALLRKDTA